MPNSTMNFCVICGSSFHVRPSKAWIKTCSHKCRLQYQYPVPEPIYQPETDTYLIPLPGGIFATIDACDVDATKFNWYQAKDRGGNVYARRTVDRANGKDRTERLHRWVLSRMLSRELCSDEIVDHINRNGLDCRRVNLRLASPTQNAANRKVRADSASGLKGAHWRKRIGKWVSSITVNKKRIHLGVFTTAEDAHAAYIAAAREYYKEFASS